MRSFSLALLATLVLVGGYAFATTTMPLLGVGNTPTGGAVGCNGTIDLSQGCAMPMLGGL